MFSNFENHNLSFLSQFSSLSFSLSHTGPSFTFTPFPLSFLPSQYFLARDLPLLLNWFSSLSSLLHIISLSNPSLYQSPKERQNIAETSILALATQSSAFSHSSPPLHYATDASTLASHLLPYSSTTFAVIANNNAFTVSLPPSRTLGILHGEAYAIAAASVLASHQSQQITIYSDHLNSVRLLSSHPSLVSLKNNPARSIYHWILDIWQSSPHKPILSHIRAHTSNSDIPSQLNRLADHLAST